MSYTAPIKDMLFDIEHLARIDQVAQLPGFEDAGLDTAQAVLQECAKFSEGVLAPLNFEGDKNPSSYQAGAVTTTPLRSMRAIAGISGASSRTSCALSSSAM